MSFQLAHVLVAALVGGLAAATVATMLAPSTDAGSSASVAAPRADDVLERRLAALEDGQRALALELAMLRDVAAAPERSDPAGTSASEGVSREEFEALARSIAGTAPRADPAPLEPQVLQEQVTSALNTIRKEEKLSAVRSYHEKRRERVDQDVGRLSERLELTSVQSDGLKTVLLAQYDREDEQRRLWEQGGNDELLAARKAEDLELFSVDLGRVLSAHQVEQFWRVVAAAGK